MQTSQKCHGLLKNSHYLILKCHNSVTFQIYMVAAEVLPQLFRAENREQIFSNSAPCFQPFIFLKSAMPF